MADDKVTMAHGAGGRMSHALMEEIILPAFGNPLLNELHDGARLEMRGEIAFTTDSYVVRPLFFRGGNIGKLAVCGTVNDLAMTGAVPRYLSAGVILEEGFPFEDLRKIVAAMRKAADEAGVAIVTGDTKVVERGKADGIFINTAGVGDLIAGTRISPKAAKPGMKVLLSGTIGDHAATVLAGRHGLALPSEIKTDCAPLAGLTQAVLAAAPHTAVLRDPTRGGVAAVLNEIAEASGCGILIDEDAIPVREAVRGVCDLLGFDPLYLANEGKCIAIVPAGEADAALEAMRASPYGTQAAIIGEVSEEAAGQVGLRTAIGGIRIVDMPLGNIVPRIC
ncbi:hydrogenase expression/formation protein HypE [Mitsuokella sp. oral taxon 131]|uniref:hydrogenase expression/formation protein HypE n=1 Tax=Mitsuokella sp. oral taxon 131 TaxID=1321780 RepID=UPI0003AE4DD6|nr:hydrogenase expression/formation protein HypE [Mitsuokella sp. oral taxon 131]ERL04280.1 hydrogenase expression/formation protein HypE [Mitsuokella sp. oral taxon 131 str. W9106]